MCVWRDPHGRDVESSSHAAFPRGRPTDGSQKGERGEAGEWVSSFTTDAGGWDARTLRVFDLLLLPVSTVSRLFSIHPQVPLAIKEDVFRV